MCIHKKKFYIIYIFFTKTSFSLFTIPANIIQKWRIYTTTMGHVLLKYRNEIMTKVFCP